MVARKEEWENFRDVPSLNLPFHPLVRGLSDSISRHFGGALWTMRR